MFAIKEEKKFYRVHEHCLGGSWRGCPRSWLLLFQPLFFLLFLRN